MKSLAICLMLSLSAICHGAPQVFGDQFAQGNLNAYVENAAEAAKFATFEDGPANRGKAIRTQKQLSFKPVPVQPDTRYRLSFHASTQSSETIEENPRLRELAFIGRSFMPSSDIHFFDKHGKRIVKGNQSFRLPYAKGHDYQWVFYPPADAVTMQWMVNPRDAANAVTVSDARLEVIKNPETININPKFDLGPFNIAGWANGMLLETDDNKTFFKADYYATSFTFPLSEPGTYELKLTASSFGRYNALFLIFLDAQGNELSRFGERPSRTRKEWIANEPEPKSHTFYLTLPEGVSRGYFLVYQSLIEEISLKRVGDEAAYSTFTQK